jgi:pSer/pThr/pTyr-binding forkhead associated (FHA) protein
MGVARDLERRLEGMMEGFFARIFRSGLQPVEVGRRIQREMEEGRTVSVNRMYAPNDFRITMGAEDFSRFSPMEPGLVREFSDLVIEQAKQNRWNLMGQPRISFEEAEDMGQGQFRVEASLTADADVPAPEVSTRQPNRADLSATHAVAADTAERLGLTQGPARLVVLDSSGAPADHISITNTPVDIGRLSSNDVVLSDPNVSRQHARLRRDGDRWVLQDLGSTNGTAVNGSAATEHELHHGDRLSFGTSELLFELGAGA